MNAARATVIQDKVLIATRNRKRLVSEIETIDTRIRKLEFEIKHSSRPKTSTQERLQELTLQKEDHQKRIEVMEKVLRLNDNIMELNLQIDKILEEMQELIDSSRDDFLSFFSPGRRDANRRH